MTSCERSRICLSGPGELIETVPYLLGFHPHESLVLIGLAGAGDGGWAQQIQVTVRLDLPGELDSLDAHALRPLSQVLRRADAEAMAAVLVTDSVRGDPRSSEELLACRDLLDEVMAEVGVEVLDVLVATELRWWSLCCEQLDCCPSAGHQRGLDCSAAAARATFAGLVALPDRQAMAATLAGFSAERRSVLLPCLAEAERRRASRAPERVADLRRADVTELLAAAARPAAQLTGEQLAGYAVALADPGVRDLLWVAIDDGPAELGRLMAELHARLPGPYDAAPLFLYGWSQWRAGNATLAMMAAERVLESQPGYSAAGLLLAAAQQGLDPRTVPALGQGWSG